MRRAHLVRVRVRVRARVRARVIVRVRVRGRVGVRVRVEHAPGAPVHQSARREPLRRPLAPRRQQARHARAPWLG